MDTVELILIAVGVSMDAFAVSIAKGIGATTVGPAQAMSAGMWFGGFQSLMSFAGYFLGRSFASVVGEWDHWVAWTLLTVIGINMIRESLSDGAEHVSATFSPSSMLPLAIATSIDALAVGISFACLNISIWMPVILIGLTTMAFSISGVCLGKVLGQRLRANAGILGGIVLMLVGLNILREHLM